MCVCADMDKCLHYTDVDKCSCVCVLTRTNAHITLMWTSVHLCADRDKCPHYIDVDKCLCECADRDKCPHYIDVDKCSCLR